MCVVCLWWCVYVSVFAGADVWPLDAAALVVITSLDALVATRKKATSLTTISLAITTTTFV